MVLSRFVGALLVLGLGLGIAGGPASPLAQEEHYQGHTGEVRLGRYSFKTPGIDPEQRKILTVVVSFEFPRRIKTVGEALTYLLETEGSGYRLASDYASCPSMRMVKLRPLPKVHKAFDAAPLDLILRTLVGEETHYLVVDPLHRLVSFETREGYSDMRMGTGPGPWLQGLQDDSGIGSPEKPGYNQRSIGETAYAPIHLDDQLYRIAQAIPRSQGIAVEQMMLALYIKNPDAFCHRNTNCLVVGETLTYPTPQELSGSPSVIDAKQIVQQHWDAWQEYAERVWEK